MTTTMTTRSASVVPNTIDSEESEAPILSHPQIVKRNTGRAKINAKAAQIAQVGNTGSNQIAQQPQARPATIEMGGKFALGFDFFFRCSFNTGKPISIFTFKFTHLSTR
jgi:hypothetical protein